MRILLFIIILSQFAWSQNFVLDDFVRELSTRQSRVEEFRHIKRIATELGIKHVYMFGGTAAAWGHYVRWDMRRELDIENLQTERFDYDYTNIFRANQDFDVVIDGTVEQAEALEAAVQKQFNYFSGTRPTWEVRLLNEKRLDKDPIMGADFQNQHTDSHSTGLIEMMDCEGFDCVKDVRDIKNPKSAFLMDLYEATLHYYFSKDHEQTLRFQQGMNPPILSVIRYFTKAVQYQLSMRKNDIKILNRIIKNFDPVESEHWNRYVLKWLEKNAKKLIVNAIDMEFAQNLLENNGLKEKLIQLGNPAVNDSMAWWLNKEALKSYPIGMGDGKTAAELFETNTDGDIIVSHETNSFPAFESITKAHDGRANVLISRSDMSGESAMFGDGHYTQIGLLGARGTGLTIRYKLHPDARENSDFIKDKSYVVIKNKNVIEVIYESLQLSAVEYFERLVNGLEFESSDLGVVEKLKRRVMRSSSKLSPNDEKSIVDMVYEPIKQGNASNELILEWFEFPISYKYPELLDSLEQNDKLEAFLLRNVFTDSKWIDHKKTISFVSKIATINKIEEKNFLESSIEFLSRIKSWNEVYHQFALQVLKAAIKYQRYSINHYSLSEKSYQKLMSDVFTQDYWIKHSDIYEVLLAPSAENMKYAAKTILKENPGLITQQLAAKYLGSKNSKEAKTEILKIIIKNKIKIRNFYALLETAVKNEAVDLEGIRSFLANSNVWSLLSRSESSKLWDILFVSNKAWVKLNVIKGFLSQKKSFQYPEVLELIKLYMHPDIIKEVLISYRSKQLVEPRENIVEYIQSNMGNHNSDVRYELFRIMPDYLPQEEVQTWTKTAMRLDGSGKFLLRLIDYLSTDDNFKNHLDLVDILSTHKNQSVVRSLVKNVISHRYWEQFPEMIERLINHQSPVVQEAVVEYVLSKSNWLGRINNFETLLESEHQNVLKSLLENILNNNIYKENNDWLVKVLSRTKSSTQQVRIMELISKVDSINSKPDFLLKTISKLSQAGKTFLINEIIFQEAGSFERHMGLVKRLLVDKNETTRAILTSKLLSSPNIINKPELLEIIVLESNSNVKLSILESLRREEHLLEIPELFLVFSGTKKKKLRKQVNKILALDKWRHHDEFKELLGVKVITLENIERNKLKFKKNCSVLYL